MRKENKYTIDNWDYIPLTETRIVGALIIGRSHYDPSRSESLQNGNIEDRICVYADLDKLLNETPLSEKERLTVYELMNGYSISDIARYYNGIPQTYEKFFVRAVEKIAEQEKKSWINFYQAGLS